MRLISQDGMLDVPYEISALSIGRMGESATIYVRSKLLDEKPCVFATYSNTDKALKIMEMLREQYMKLGMIKILASGTCEYMDKSLEKEEKMGIYADYCRKHCFKFPDDLEVEV